MNCRSTLLYSLLFVGLSVIFLILSPILIPIFFIVILPLLIIAVIFAVNNPQKTAAFVLQSYRRYNLFKLQLQRKTPTDASLYRLVSGETWQDFCDVLAAAGAFISKGPTDAQTQAEGYRFLARLTRVGLAHFLEYSDPNVPQLHSLVGPTVKMGADNPDNQYETAPLQGAYSYKIYGTRGTVKYLSFGTQKGHYGKDARMPPISFIDHLELQFSDTVPSEKRDSKGNPFDSKDQYFELAICPERLRTKDDKNWLGLLESDSATLIVRQTFGDRSKEIPANLVLERNRLSDDGLEMKSTENSRYLSRRKPLDITPIMVDDGLSQASALVGGAANLFVNWAKRMGGETEDINNLPPFDTAESDSYGGDPNIFYYHSYYKLARYEALVIYAKRPKKCLFWNFQLNNHWMESLDYRYYPICINSDSAKYFDRPNENEFMIIVCHEDKMYRTDLLPMEYKNKPLNWLSTANHEIGTMCFRWVKAEGYRSPICKTIELCKTPAISRTNTPHKSGITAETDMGALDIDATSPAEPRLATAEQPLQSQVSMEKLASVVDQVLSSGPLSQVSEEKSSSIIQDDLSTTTPDEDTEEPIQSHDLSSEKTPTPTPESVKEATPEALPKDHDDSSMVTTEAVKEATPEALPKDHDDSFEAVKEATPESSLKDHDESSMVTVEAVKEATPESLPKDHDDSSEAVKEGTPELLEETTPEPLGKDQELLSMSPITAETVEKAAQKFQTEHSVMNEAMIVEPTLGATPSVSNRSETDSSAFYSPENSPNVSPSHQSQRSDDSMEAGAPTPDIDNVVDV